MIKNWRRMLSVLVTITVLFTLLPLQEVKASSIIADKSSNRVNSLAASAQSNVSVTANSYGNTIPSRDERRVIITFKEKADKSLIKGSIKREHKSLPIIAANLSTQEVDTLRTKAAVASIEPDIPIQATAETIGWGVNVVQATYGWNTGYTGKDVKVAVIDSGINTHHDDLTVAGGISFVDYTASYDDDHGHGTHVAGIIGAKKNDYGIAGVAPEASLYAVKVLDSQGVGYLSDVIAGIDWAVENKMDIVNLSLGTGVDSPALHHAVDYAYSRGILIVASAGNTGNSNGTGDTIQFPARYSSVIAVGAVDQGNQRAAFSATGNELDVVAPGVEIQSTYLSNGYATLSGTSAAAPYVAGLLALMKQKKDSSSHKQIRNQLNKYTLDLGQQGKDSLYGYGLVQWTGNGSIANLHPSGGLPVTDNVYKNVIGNVYLNAAMAGSPTVRYMENGYGPYEDTQYWPNLSNVISISFHQEVYGDIERCALNTNSTVQCIRNYQGYTYDDSANWPSLLNAKSISRNMDIYSYENRCVLYGDNTVKCKDYYNGISDDTANWPSLSNAKSISYTTDEITAAIRCVLYKDNTIKCKDFRGLHDESGEFWAYWPSLVNAKSISHQLTPDYGSLINYVGYLNVSPTIESITNNTQYVIKNTGSNVIALSGTIRDFDDDSITISATIAGVTRSAVIDSAFNTKPWTLQWNVDSDNIPAGTYSNIAVTANDGVWGTASTSYPGVIFVDTPPNVPSSLSPGIASASEPALISGISPTLNWTFTDPDSGDYQSAFNVQILNGGSLIYDTGWANSGALSYAVPAGLLARGGTYGWRVAVKDNKGGASAFSPVYYIKPNSLPASTITSYYDGQSIGTNILSLSWNYSDSNGQAQYAFQIQASRDNWATVGYNTGTVVSGAASHQTIALPDGTWSVKLLVHDGMEWSDAAYRNGLIVRDTTPPSAPGSLTKSDVTATSVALQWNASTDNMGISGYNIYRDASFIGTTPNGVTTYTATGLSANTMYQFTVVAVDTSGNVSNPSNAVSVLYDTIPPTAPSISLSNWTGSQVTATIVPGTDSGTGVQKSQYKIHSGGTWTDYVSPVVVSTLGQPTFYARTIDHAGNIGPEASTTIPDNTAPTNPTNLRVVSQTGTTVQLAWDEPEDDVGVVSYDILMGGAVQGTSTTTSFQVTGLTEGSSYQFSVRARDAAGNTSGESNRVSITIPDYTAPSVPANLRVASQAGTSVTLAWDASTDNIGVTDYDILSGATIVVNSTTTGYLFTGLTEGSTYQFSVRAKDAAKNSSASSNVVTVTIPDYTAPSAPANVSVTAQTGTTVSLGWNASADNVGIAGYDILVGATLMGSSTTTSYEVTGLKEATAYTFSIRARDAAGNVSGSSPPVSATTADLTAPAAPSGLRATDRTGSSLNLVWNSTTDNVGVSRYDVYMGTTLLGSTPGTSFPVSGLSAGATYQFTVKAIDQAGNISSTSNALSAMTVLPAPASNGYTPHITLKKLIDNGNNPDTTQTSEDAANWPSLTNAKSISFHTRQGSIFVERFVLYNDNTIRRFTFDGSSTTSSNDTASWPSLANSKAITYSYDNAYMYRCVLYTNNTVLCNKYDYTSYDRTTTLIDDTANWPNVSNAKSISRFDLLGNSVLRHVVYNDNTVKLYRLFYGSSTPVVSDETAKWPDVSGARSIAYSSTDSYEYRYAAYVDANPVIQLSSVSDQTAYVNGSPSTITLSGTVSDPDNDNVTISATLAGVTKSTTLSNTAAFQPWSLQWNVNSDPIAPSAYSNIPVNVTDGWGSSMNTMYTGMIRVNRLPNTPSQLSPGQANTPDMISSLTPTLRWVFSDPDAGDAQLAYHVVVNDQQTGAVSLDTGWVNSGATSHNVPSGNLGRGKAYRWQVRVKDSHGGESSYSSASLIRMNQLPTMEYTGGEQHPNQVYSFTWNYSDGDGQAQAAYRVVGSKDNWATTSFDTGMVQSSAVSYTTPSLTNGTWDFKIAVSDGMEWSELMPLGIVDKVPPTAPGKLTLVNKATGTASLTWQTSTDNIALAGYDVYNGDVIAVSTGAAETNVTVPNTVPNRLYIFTVKARDTLGNVSASSNTVYYYNGEYHYMYDARGRIDYIQLSSGQKLKYEYDSNGNLLRVIVQ